MPKQQKLERRALFLQSYNYYEIRHIAGEDIVWADLLTRWGVAGEMALKARRTRMLIRELMAFEALRVTPKNTVTVSSACGPACLRTECVAVRTVSVRRRLMSGSERLAGEWKTGLI